MKPTVKKIIKYAYLPMILLVLYLGGCASTPQGEEEGGISGTGHSINCEDLKHKAQELCRQKY